MSAPAGAMRNGNAAGRLAAGLVLLTLGWAALLHHGLGPSFRHASWIEPSSFLLGDVPDQLLPALVVLVLPSAAVAVAVAFLTRSALARTLALVATVASACFVFYGLEAAQVWRFFHWRWSVSILLFAAVVGAALEAPLLAARWRALRWPLRAASYLPVFAALVLYETNVTGTDPELPLALSPWPVVQILGLEFAAPSIAALQIGVGLGMLGLSRGSWARAVGALAAGGVPLVGLAAGAASGVLLFRPQPIHYLGAALLCLAVLAASAVWPPRGSSARAERARNLVLGGVLLGAPLVCGQLLTRFDYSETRNLRAQRIIDALAEYDRRNASYPDRLDQLVSAGLLGSVPRPLGGLFSGQEFVYQNFGDTYLLEFSAPRWIQCAYNPPWHPEPGEQLEGEEAEDLGGAWSCPQKPPELW